jgi:hypothetical protein
MPWVTVETGIAGIGFVGLGIFFIALAAVTSRSNGRTSNSRFNVSPRRVAWLLAAIGGGFLADSIPRLLHASLAVVLAAAVVGSTSSLIGVIGLWRAQRS